MGLTPVPRFCWPVWRLGGMLGSLCQGFALGGHSGGSGGGDGVGGGAGIEGHRLHEVSSVSQDLKNPH